MQPKSLATYRYTSTRCYVTNSYLGIQYTYFWDKPRVYETLPLKNLFSSKLILFCGVQKSYYQLMSFLSIERNENPLLFPWPPLSWLTLCTTTKSNLYLANSLTPAVSEPVPYSPQIFQATNLISLFRCLGRSRVLVQVPRFSCKPFITGYVFTARSC